MDCSETPAYQMGGTEAEGNYPLFHRQKEEEKQMACLTLHISSHKPSQISHGLLCKLI